MIKLSELIDESDASDAAHKQGLTGKGPGRWYDSDGNFVAQTIDGKLKWIYKQEPHNHDIENRDYLDPTVRNQEKLINRAANFAINAYDEKQYGGKPYRYHLKKVYDNTVRFGGTAASRVAGILHDVLKDKLTTTEELKKQFGAKVANIVELVTDQGSKEETYQRIRTNPEAVYVELCNRLANIEEGQNIDEYRADMPLFKKMLHTRGEYETTWWAIEKALATKS